MTNNTTTMWMSLAAALLLAGAGATLGACGDVSTDDAGDDLGDEVRSSLEVPGDLDAVEPLAAAHIGRCAAAGSRLVPPLDGMRRLSALPAGLRPRERTTGPSAGAGEGSGGEEPLKIVAPPSPCIFCPPETTVDDVEPGVPDPPDVPDDPGHKPRTDPGPAGPVTPGAAIGRPNHDGPRPPGCLTCPIFEEAEEELAAP